MDALSYWLRTGCAWEELPHDIPPKGTVYDYWRQWTRDGTWRRMHSVLGDRVRLQAGKATAPTAALLDTQRGEGQPSSVGYDAAKRLKGRKQHLLVDTLGFLLGLAVQTGHVQDHSGSKAVLTTAAAEWPSLGKVWAGGAYRRQLETWVDEHCPFTLAKAPEQPGFVLLPMRWIVEHKFACRMRSGGSGAILSISCASAKRLSSSL